MTPACRILPVRAPLEEAARRLAGALDRELAGQGGRIGLLLSGGRTPRALLPLLLARGLDWSRIEVAASDERLVPVDHPASTEGMIRAAFDEAGRPLRYRGFGPDCTPAAALDHWRAQLEAMPWPPAAAFLGMGEDAHVASLFPGRPEVLDEGLFADAVPQTPPHPEARLTLGMRALQSCREIVMIVSGAEKLAALARAMAPGADARAFPAALLARLPQVTILVPEEGLEPGAR